MHQKQPPAKIATSSSARLWLAIARLISRVVSRAQGLFVIKIILQK